MGRSCRHPQERLLLEVGVAGALPVQIRQLQGLVALLPAAGIVMDVSQREPAQADTQFVSDRLNSERASVASCPSAAIDMSSGAARNATNDDAS